MPFETQVPKKRGRKKSSINHEEIKELYSNGMKPKQISEKLNYPISTVYSVLRDVDKQKNEKWEEIRKLYKEGMTQRELAKKFNYTQASICRIVNS